MREYVLAALLALAAVLVVVGVAMLSEAAGWIAAGVAVAAWSWLMLGEVKGE